MSGTPKRSPLLALLAAAGIIVAACVGASTPSPAASVAPSAAPSVAPSVAAFTPMVYPTTGTVDCAAHTYNSTAYTGQIKQIKALDANTVEFDMCQPDVAFLSKIAVNSSAIQQKDWLVKALADGSYLDHANGTGPYPLQEWVKRDHITFAANPNYWGTTAVAPTTVRRWSTEAAQRLTEPREGLNVQPHRTAAMVPLCPSLRGPDRGRPRPVYGGSPTTP